MLNALRTYQSGMVWVGLAALVLWRLADFFRLAHGSADDMTVDYVAMSVGWKTMALQYAEVQSRIYSLVVMPVYALMMNLAGSVWYDILNDVTFVAGAILPVLALRRYIETATIQLFILVYFATLPLLFSYTPPYAYPAYMFLPLAFGGLALWMLDAWHVGGHRPSLVCGCVLLFFGLCGYEPISLLIVTYLGFWAWCSQRARPEISILRRPELWLCAGVLAVYCAAYLAFRMRFPSEYGGVRPAMDLSLASIARVVGTLSFTSSIFGWYHFRQMLVRVDIPFSHESLTLLGAPGFSEMLSQATPAVLLGAVLTFCLSAVLATRILARPSVRPFRLVLFACALLVVPNLLYGFIPKISRLVLAKQLYAYTATAYSQTGLALLAAALTGCAGLFRMKWFRLAPVFIVSLTVTWGWIAASEFNTISAVFAREQEAKWTAVQQLAACRGVVPPAYLDQVVAPRLWNFSTARLSWGQEKQDRRYWDLYAQSHLHLKTHFVRTSERAASPVTALDYKLRPDGSLAGVILARSSDGKRFQEVFLMKTRRADIPAGVLDRKSIWQAQTTANTASCENGVEAVRLTGADLDVSSAQIDDLPPANLPGP